MIQSGKLLLCSVLLFPCCTRQAPEHEVVFPRLGQVQIPLSQVDDGKAHFFTLKRDGKNINFFVRTDGEGSLQSHFDACHSCFKYKLGYVQEGGQVVCIACRIGYDLKDSIWDYVGPCVPISLKSRQEGEMLVVEMDRLEKGSRFF